jgi:hypothetical protein
MLLFFRAPVVLGDTRDEEATRSRRYPDRGVDRDFYMGFREKKGVPRNLIPAA